MMNVPFYISRRYLFSKKSHHAINIITWISVVCVAVVTFALVVILSGLNGLSDVVENLYNSFASDIRVEAAKGKTFTIANEKKKKILSITGVSYCEEVIEENTLVNYHDRQLIVTMKGVTPGYLIKAGVTDFIDEGEPVLLRDTINYTITGRGIYDRLEINYETDYSPVEFYVPKKGASLNIDPISNPNPFRTDHAFVSGVFHLNDDFDYRFVYVPLSFARGLIQSDSAISALEIGLDENGNSSDVMESVEKILGEGFNVKDRFRQNELLFKTLETEKLWVFIILLFILVVATFNIIGSLTMLIIEKKKDVSVLRSLGAPPAMVRRIFIIEGLLITVSGAIIGLVLGIAACWLQQRYGLIEMEEGFVVDYYPVIVRVTDLMYILASVIIIGYAASFYPVRFFTSRSYRHLSSE